MTEVPVSMETKLKNIEQIERAKRRILDRALGVNGDGDGDGANRIKRSDLPVFFGRVEQKRKRARERERY